METTLSQSSASLIHGQTSLLQEAQKQKHDAFESFLSDLSEKTLKGTLAGFTFGVVACGKFKFTKFAALGAGIGTGIALNNCAVEFNKIQRREHKVNAYIVNKDSDDFERRYSSASQLYGKNI
ncbi:hypothetical protein FGO68_gene13568 [Halteria grandinella]|uniref:Uncharacterized protein n=1 Tax=Halteria grandinella TaxID=5974 RepID=A0A8J8NUT2_HALGN|nr:hypothetical protein FGO68_gene13568 [Halteria grandinella]